MRRALAIVAVVGAAAGLVSLGRWEQGRVEAEETAGFRHVLTLIEGAIDSPRLSGFRAGPPLCFTYHVGVQRFGAQLCFDREGRLIEAVDRLDQEPRYWSLAYRPQLSSIRVDPSRLDMLIGLVEGDG